MSTARLVLRTTTGEVFDVSFRLDGKVAELLQRVLEQHKFSPKFKLIFNCICLNDFPDREYPPTQRAICRIKDFGIVNMSELIVTNHEKRTVFGTFPLDPDPIDEIREQDAKRSAQHKDDTMMIYGREVKVDPASLDVDSDLIAHVTNAKTPIKQRKDRAAVFSLHHGVEIARSSGPPGRKRGVAGAVLGAGTTHGAAGCGEGAAAGGHGLRQGECRVCAHRVHLRIDGR